MPQVTRKSPAGVQRYALQELDAKPDASLQDQSRGIRQPAVNTSNTCTVAQGATIININGS